MASELDFPLLDDVLPMLAHGRNTIAAAITAATAGAVGPLLEFAFQANAHGGRLPSLKMIEQAIPVVALQRTLGIAAFARVSVSISHEAQPVEFSWLPPEPDQMNNPQWIMFLRRFQNAAKHSGFPEQIAKGLVGAFVEMTDNVLQHSKRACSGIGGYRWTSGCFEYAVADAGIGVLASLRSCSDYSQITDAGNALEIALQDGESRHGRYSAHGNGFRQVLVSLTNLNGSLRFRSGDHVLTIDGTSPNLTNAFLHHLGLDYRGLLVSVVCRTN